MTQNFSGGINDALDLVDAAIAGRRVREHAIFDAAIIDWLIRLGWTDAEAKTLLRFSDSRWAAARAALDVITQPGD